jgi:hypothetical protein
MEEQIVNQIAESNKSLEAIHGLASVTVDKLDKIASKIKKTDNSDICSMLDTLIQATNEPIKLNVKLNIK